uniref:ANK_REP_REGION domain-containing protein n=1 Tax=Heterorhabditis bacteriophora TaxID=37862 RepID=A0A1I7WIZ4_HETBA
MPEGLAVEERKGGLPKSLSDTEMSTSSGQAGDRLWLILANTVEEPITVAFSIDGYRIEAADIILRQTLLTFTVPSLPCTEDRDIQMILSNITLQVTIPFSFKATNHSETYCNLSLDSLIEFATTGEIFSLIQPFAKLIADVDSERNTILHIAAKNMQSYALKSILSVIPETEKEGFDVSYLIIFPNILNVRNCRGQTALHCAIRAGDPDSVHYLMNHGAATNIPDNHKNTAIHYLADAYNEAIFKEILEPAREQISDLEALNDEGKKNNFHLISDIVKLKKSHEKWEFPIGYGFKKF